MKNSPNLSQEPQGNLQSLKRNLRLILLSRAGISVGIILLLGIVGSLGTAWFFVQYRLAPLVQENLTQTLNRPVQLGRVESFSPIGLRFGRSAIPATSTDSDRLAMQSVDVAFNPLKLLFSRTLQLDVTLVNPVGYIEQDSQGRWVATTIKAGENKGLIKTDLQAVRVTGGNVVLVPFPNPGDSSTPVAITQVNGSGSFFDQNQRIGFEANGQLVNGGNFNINGENRPAAGQTNMAIAGQNLSASDVSRLIKLQVVKLQAGRVDGNLEVRLRRDQPASFLGTTRFQQATVQIPKVPKTFTQTTGIVGFKDTEIQLQNISTVYGQVPGLVNGVIDTKLGYNVSAQTVPVGLQNILNTLDLKSPVTTVGEARASIKLTGRLEQPILSGTAVTTKTAQIDRLNFRAIKGNFAVANTTVSITDVRAVPEVGGEITGSGQVKLGEKGGVVFDVQAENLSGDAIAQIYGTKPSIRIGPVSGKGQVFGPPGNFLTVLNLQAPNATYPGTSEVVVTPGGKQVLFRNTTFQVAGGTVKGTGFLNGDRWQASLQASSVQGRGLAPLLGGQVPPQLQGLLSGTFNLSGNNRSFQKETIQANGSGSLQLAGGTITASNVQLGGGNWRGNFNANGVQIAQLSPQIPAQLRGRLNGNFNLAGSLTEFKPETIQGTGSGRLNVAAGTIIANNVQLGGGNWRGNFNTSGVQLAQLSPQIPAQLKNARLTGNFNLAGSLAEFKPETIQGTGSGRLNVATGTITANNVQLGGGNWRGNFNANGVQIAQLSPQIPAQLRGRLNGNFNLAGSLTEFKPETIQGTGSGRLNVAAGTITANNVQLGGGNWRGNFNTSGVQLAQLSPQIPAQLKNARLTGNFNLGGSLTAFKPETIQGSGSGRLNLPEGTITASSLQLTGGNWLGAFAVKDVQLARLSPQVPPQLQKGKLTGNFNLSGSLTAFKPETIQGTGAGRLNLPQGTITAASLQLRDGNWQGSFGVNDVQLAQLSPQVPPQLQKGRLTGNFNLSGNLTAFKPETIQGTGAGRLNLSDGTITASSVQLSGGRWQGDFAVNDVQLAQLSPQVPSPLEAGKLTGNFNLSGSLTAFKPETIQGTGSGRLNLPDGTINASSLELSEGRWKGSFAAENIEVASLAQLSALSSFSEGKDTPPLRGRLSGTVEAAGSLAAFNPAAIQASGQLRLENFAADGLEFAPILTGQVSVAPGQGVNLNLAGGEDRIEVALSPTFRPTSFYVKNGETIASGKSEGDRLLVNSEKFPISILKTFAPVPEAIASQPLSGLLSGNFDINLANLSIVGSNVQIDQPIIGSLKGDKLTGNFQYANGVGVLTGAEFQQGDSRYLLSGSLTQTATGPQFQARLNIPKGQIQNILTALQVFELQDLTRGFTRPTFGTASDIQPAETEGLPNSPLQSQLRRLSEIQALLTAQRDRREASPIPELRDLQGTFTGEITVAGSLQQGIRATFALQGSEWKWGDYTANQVIAKGNFENGVLSFLPLRLESEETVVAYSGTVGGDEQSGQVRVENLPIERLQDFVNLPVNITGRVNATATLTGSIQNPAARGNLSLMKGTLNQTPIQTAQGSFDYADARLNFYTTALVSGNDPLQVTGNIPYKLPFATTEPTSNQVSVKVNVENQGLALINLLSRGQVAWVDGQGKVQLSIQGTLDKGAEGFKQLVAEGIATVDNATIQAQALPEPLTNVTGTVLFNFDTIQVQSLQGKFSKGQVVAQGIIPISNPQPTDNPLTVTLDQLALTLKGRYSGGVNGNVVVTGTALSPKIGGELQLVNGQVLLEDTANAATPTSSSGSGSQAQGSGLVEFNNLQLSLGKGVQITRPPILNFLATGNLTINGTLDNLRPEGIVQLDRGQVNLFTTQFRLARGYPQTAVFTPNQGLVPDLDVRLVAIAPETTRSRLPSNPLSTEISDVPVTSLGALQTIRIEARVEGPANQFAENLRLTSNPGRSEAEIVALLGGGFLDTLGRGDTTLGLANLAGSAVLSNVQNVIGYALGLSDFRLFPTITRNQKRQTSTLGLGAEAGLDLSPKVSASILKILTADDPPQYNLRYRLNDQTLLRGSTDLSGDSRAVVEYERRF